jgi:hypothetical protein
VTAEPDDSASIRSRRRGLGPFTGGQLTAIVITFVVVIGFPVGAFAVVSGSNSFVTDATSGKQAKVNSLGQLATTATPAAPASMYAQSDQYVLTSGSPVTAVTGGWRAGLALVITSLTVGPEGILNSPVTLEFETSSGSHPAMFTLNPGTPPVTVPFPSGMPVANGDDLDIRWVSPGNSVTLDVSFDGYWVPASQCTAGCG